MLVFMRVLYPGQIGIWSVAFCGERKTLGLRKEPTTNSTQICTGLESNPAHNGGRLVLSSLHHPLLPLMFALSREQFPLAISTPVKWKAAYLHLYNTKIRMLFASNNINVVQRSGMSGHLHKVGVKRGHWFKMFCLYGFTEIIQDNMELRKPLYLASNTVQVPLSLTGDWSATEITRIMCKLMK